MKILLENWKKFINENKNINNVWYHTTSTASVDSIMRDGLKINSSPNYSKASLNYMIDVYGMVPIFVSKTSEPYDKNKQSVVLSVDVSGLPLVSDIPTLISHHEGYFDDFENNGIWLGDNLMLFQDLLNPNSTVTKKVINLTNTAAIMVDIPVDRIKVL